MTDQDDRGDKEKRILVPQTEIEELRRLKFIQEAKEELIAWGKRWTIIMTIVVSVIGLIGINVVVATVIRGFVADDIKDAQKTANVATEYLNRARSEMEKATKAASDYTEQVQKMKDQAETIDKSLKTLGSTIEGKGRTASEEASLLNKNFQTRLAVIEKGMGDLIAKSASSRAAADFRTEAERLEREGAARRAAFLSNREYKVQIAFFEKKNNDADHLASVFAKLGFQTEITSEGINAEEDVGVEKGTLSKSRQVVVLHDKGEEEKGTLIAKEVDLALSKGPARVIAVPPSPYPKQIVVFLPRNK